MSTCVKIIKFASGVLWTQCIFLAWNVQKKNGLKPPKTKIELEKNMKLPTFSPLFWHAQFSEQLSSLRHDCFNAVGFPQKTAIILHILLAFLPTSFWQFFPRSKFQPLRISPWIWKDLFELTMVLIQFSWILHVFLHYLLFCKSTIYRPHMQRHWKSLSELCTEKNVVVQQNFSNFWPFSAIFGYFRDPHL